MTPLIREFVDLCLKSLSSFCDWTQETFYRYEEPEGSKVLESCLLGQHKTTKYLTLVKTKFYLLPKSLWGVLRNLLYESLLG